MFIAGFRAVRIDSTSFFVFSLCYGIFRFTGTCPIVLVGLLFQYYDSSMQIAGLGTRGTGTCGTGTAVLGHAELGQFL